MTMSTSKETRHEEDAARRRALLAGCASDPPTTREATATTAAPTTTVDTGFTPTLDYVDLQEGETAEGWLLFDVPARHREVVLKQS
jgi:hypothetical protein